MNGKKRVFVIGEINKMSIKSLYAYNLYLLLVSGDEL